MIHFSVPADFRMETIDAMHALNQEYSHAQVLETYGQVTDGPLVNSGRVTDGLPQIDMVGLGNYVQYARKKGIKFNYTINPACFGNIEFSDEGIETLHSLLEKLLDIGVEWLTIASPSIMEMVCNLSMPFHIKASAICEITTPSKALFYLRRFADRIVIDPDITRNFDALKNISEVGQDAVEIIVNNVCLKNCAYKMFHYMHEAHCTKDNHQQTIKDYYYNRCSMQKADDLANLVKLNWVRPEDLVLYKSCGIKYFKLQGRQNVLQGDVVRALRCYFDEDYAGDLFELITLFAPYNAFQPYIDNKSLDGFVQMFYQNPGFCEQRCDRCGYCENVAKACMNVEEARKLGNESDRFFRNTDHFMAKMALMNTGEELINSVFRMPFDEDKDFEID